MEKISFASIRDLLRKRVSLSRKIPIGQVKFGDLRRVTPLFPNHESAGSMAVDTYYISSFLRREANNINGRILAGDLFFHLNIDIGNLTPLLFDDEEDFLNALENLKAESFDGIILIQELQLVYELQRVFRLLHRALKAGGTLLATVPGTCHSNPRPEGFPGYRAFTPLSLRKQAEEIFSAKNIAVEGYGNVLAATAMLHGFSSTQFRPAELQDHDRQYPLIISLKAVR